MAKGNRMFRLKERTVCAVGNERAKASSQVIVGTFCVRVGTGELSVSDSSGCSSTGFSDEESGMSVNGFGSEATVSGVEGNGSSACGGVVHMFGVCRQRFPWTSKMYLELPTDPL